MELQKNFKTSAFGGFNKEEVVEYITAVSDEYEDSMANLKDELNQTSAQLAEFKAIVEEQYARIVEATSAKEEQEEAARLSNEECERLRLELAECEEKASRLSAENLNLLEENGISRGDMEKYKAELAVYQNADIEAHTLVANAQSEALKLSDQMKKQLADASNQVKIMVEQATDKTNGILEPAKEEAKRVLEEARAQAGKITGDVRVATERAATSARLDAERTISAAKSEAERIVASAREQGNDMLYEAKRQIENTIALNEENEERARHLVDAAKRESEELISRASITAREEKGRYEDCLKALESQKAKLLTTLDHIREEVTAVKIVQPQKSEKEVFSSLRENTTEALRRKFTNMNRERYGGKS